MWVLSGQFMIHNQDRTWINSFSIDTECQYLVGFNANMKSVLHCNDVSGASDGTKRERGIAEM